MAPVLPAEQEEKQRNLAEIKKRFAKEIEKQNSELELILDNLLRIQNIGIYKETEAANTIELLLNPYLVEEHVAHDSDGLAEEENWSLKKALEQHNLSKYSLFSEKNLETLSKLKALSTKDLSLITADNDDLSETFCKTIINRLFTDNITEFDLKHRSHNGIKDPIKDDITAVDQTNLKKIVDKANLSAEELKKIASKLLSKKDVDPKSQEQSLAIYKDIIVENKKFNATVAETIITKINQLNNQELETKKAELLKDVLTKLLDNKDKDLAKLVKKLCETKDINDTNKSDILNTIINHKNLTPELAEILLNKYASSIEEKHLETIIGVMDDNPNIIKIIFSTPHTKELIGQLNDNAYIQLIKKAETATDLNTMLTAKQKSTDASSDTLATSISPDAADALVSKICSVYNKTIPASSEPTLFESFVTRPIRTFFESIRDAFPPTTDRKQCKEMLVQITSNTSLLEKLSQENVGNLMKIAPTTSIFQGLVRIFKNAESRPAPSTGSDRAIVSSAPPAAPTKAIREDSAQRDDKLDGTTESLGAASTTPPPSAKSRTPTTDPSSSSVSTRERLGNIETKFTVTASGSRDLDPATDPKVSKGQQLDYDQFIEKIGTDYKGEPSRADSTFKIYKQDDADKQNTLMEKKADGSLVFRKEFDEGDAKLFLESIKLLAETSTTGDKLTLQMDNFNDEQLNHIRNLVIKDPQVTKSYQELLSRVEFLSADGNAVVDLSQKPLQASPQLVAKPPDADALPARPQSAQVRGKPTW